MDAWSGPHRKKPWRCSRDNARIHPARGRRGSKAERIEGGADIFQVTRERFPRLRPRRNIPSLPSLSGEGLRFSTIW